MQEKQHIGNFFLFLQQKENREMPLIIKIDYFTSLITQEDIDNIGGHLRARYYNKTTNPKIHFTNITKFNKFGNELSVAQLENGAHIIINKQGIPTIEGVNFNIYENPELLTAYFNTKNKPKILYRYIQNYGQFAKNLALVERIDGTRIFIDRNGLPSLEGLDYGESDTNFYESVIKNTKNATNSELSQSVNGKQ